ncbi:MAG: hypothetical protein OEY03_08230 [Rhizobacter sp.]|nr:hypothetical protein [Rhizobacter sp.]
MNQPQPALQYRPAVRITAHDQIGFELGWDYAHHRVCPPEAYAQAPSPLRDGLLAGQATFGLRTLNATRAVRKWLQLRLNAWLRGRSVELVQVTPHYLAQIDVSHCPITRAALSGATLGSSDASPANATPPEARSTAASDDRVESAACGHSIDRVRNDAGYAAGNLAVMSTKANHAKAACGFRDAILFVRQVEAGALGGIDGLTAAQWARVAVLCSFVEPIEHDEACALPLLVLPPNRLRLFNPAQALQAFVSRQLLVPGWSRRVSRIEALVPGKPAQRAFQSFFHALLPRVLEAGRNIEPHEARWAIEDAWRNALVQRRWTAFARQLSAAQCEAIVRRATAKKLATGAVNQISDAQATEGWNLATRGYVAQEADDDLRQGRRLSATIGNQLLLAI